MYVMVVMYLLSLYIESVLVLRVVHRQSAYRV